MSPVVLGAAAAAVVLALTGRPAPPRRVVDLARAAPATDPVRPPRAPGAVTPVRRLGGAPSRASQVTVTSSLDLAGAVDLLAVAVSAGLSPLEAVHAVGTTGRGRAAGAFAEVARRTDRGRSLGDALPALVEQLGPAAAPLAATLTAAVGAGTPLGPVLARLADAERDRARRAAATAARRLPVVLLGPLVGLVLPAFVVLTLVPVGIATFHRAALVPAGAAPSLSPSEPQAPSAAVVVPRS